jgi:hypothetical protein
MRIAWRIREFKTPGATGYAAAGISPYAKYATAFVPSDGRRSDCATPL